MPPKTREITLDTAQATLLAQAIRSYAHAAFPAGGSECAQVSRSTLLDTADVCASHRGGSLSLRRRQFPLLRAAVRWALSDEGPAEVNLPEDFESLLD